MIKKMWAATFIAATVAALGGIINVHIYDRVFAPEFIPGALPQDILTGFLCIFSLIALVKNKKLSLNLISIMSGVVGSLFYLYGIFVIERIYTEYYLVYALVFSLSFWSIVCSLIHVSTFSKVSIKLAPWVQKLSASFGLLIAVLFSCLWIATLLPLMKEHKRIDYLYSIYILDLCFIMPAFFITSILTLQNKMYGLLFLPSVYIVGFFVIFPLGLNELAKSLYGQTPSFPSMIMSFVFALLMLGMGSLQLKKMSGIRDSNP